MLPEEEMGDDISSKNSRYVHQDLILLYSVEFITVINLNRLRDYTLISSTIVMYIYTVQVHKPLNCEVQVLGK